ncbi:MAG: SulP family inorganic anion transporter [Planctomycetota bacterium]|nr:SulP family inorganic anion transporter [Planctomycetota bacterium]
MSGLVVFLVALPLCLGVALASEAPLFSGLLAGIVGGILVGILSGSHTSVSGPAAGLTAVVAAQINSLESFQTFLLAVVIAGVIQIALGVAKAGFIASFFPTSVIKGLLAAIGVILILKQIPHIFGHDADPEGDMAFFQTDHENTFSELAKFVNYVSPGATAIGLFSLVVLVLWDRTKTLKKSIVPSALVVVLIGIAANWLFGRLGYSAWVVSPEHLVQVPVAESLDGFLAFLQLPDFTQWNNPKVYVAALTIAAVASLETLLNLEAVDKLDPQQRNSPASRELWAQGVGNVTAGLIGGLPITSVVIRSSVNINAGGKTKLSAIIHGIFLLTSVALLPTYLNLIPLSSLAAILLVTGVKLVSPALVKKMWAQGNSQFVPFVTTVLAIVVTDLLIGVLIGLAVSVCFILHSNLRRPIRRFKEKHIGGEVQHIELANQVSFLNRAALSKAFDQVPRGGHLLIDAVHTDYIDPDVLDLIRAFKEETGPARGVMVSLRGFRGKYQFEDETQFVDYSTRELQSALTPEHVLDILKAGHQRFLSGHRLTRDLGRQVSATAESQHPLAVVLSCVDARTPTELIFDLGVGDIISVRIAGNIVSRKVVGSIEYGCAVAGAKLLLVIGHTRCGAVTAAVQSCCGFRLSDAANECMHLEHIVKEIEKSIDPADCRTFKERSDIEREAIIDNVARRNVLNAVDHLLQHSRALDDLVQEGRIAIVGAMYNVVTREIEFLTNLEGKRKSDAVSLVM